MLSIILPTVSPLVDDEPLVGDGPLVNDGGNPFSTRRVRPGALGFIFSDSLSAKCLVKRLTMNHWWGQIVGPHGSGKSTLLASLIALIKPLGHNILHITLHDRERHLPLVFLNSILENAAESSDSLLVIVDGYEQLSRWSRFRLKRLCRRERCGLLVTAHQSVGLPMLHRTEPSLDSAHRVVEHLQQGYTTTVDSAEVDRCYAQQKGNLREMLFDLYDLHEIQRS